MESPQGASERVEESLATNPADSVWISFRSFVLTMAIWSVAAIHDGFPIRRRVVVKLVPNENFLTSFILIVIPKLTVRRRRFSFSTL